MDFMQYLDKVNDMVAHAHKNIVCGTECKKSKKKAELKKIYNNAINNNKMAPEELETAKKNYFEYSKGKDFYQNMMEKEYDEKRIKFINQYLNKRLEKTTEIETLIENYKVSNYYNNNVNQYLEDQINQYDELKREKSNTIGKSLTNNRLTHYSNISNKNIIGITNIIKKIYIILIIAYALLVIFYGRFFVHFNYIIIISLIGVYVFLTGFNPMIVK